MAAHPRSPHPELKARVLGRALQRPRRIWPLAAAAAFLLAVGGGGGHWASRTIPGLRAGGGTVSAPLPAPGETRPRFIPRAAGRVGRVRGSAGGRVRGRSLLAR